MATTAELERRVQELEKQVQELEDRATIQTLRMRFHECVNEKNPDAIGALFSNDAELHYSHLGTAIGREKITRFFQKGLSELVPFVKQYLHNHVVTVNGNTATGLSYLEATPVHKDESYLVAARFDDTYVKENGRWYFKKVNLTPYFMVPLKEGWAQEDRLKMGR
jgi:ketosteroid isomerase-like protein